MNYRHSFHAGNFADVLKHAALVWVIRYLQKKPTPIAVIDTHAGAGLYNLSGVEAAKTGEAKEGILRLAETPDLPGVLARYAALVAGFGGGLYPGSPLIAAKLMRPKDRLVAVEAEDGAFAALAAALADFPRVRAVKGDGYRELNRSLPPPERRGVILIDPPYEAAEEFEQATRAAIMVHRRFASGIVLFWYPAKHRASVGAAAGELKTAGIASLVRLELDVGTPRMQREEGRGPPLTAAGLLVVNPPFGFADEMRAVLTFLADRLARGPRAAGRVEILAEPR
jgi:23S rRNA (adenine2030-N6)-methyltransferase